MYRPINPDFFVQPVLELAPALLGQYIVHETPEGLAVARIVETEAYHGPEDRAAHSFNNRRTKRTEVMFADPGRIYTYQMHTHTLMNVVAGDEGTPHAVLIRGAEPVEGLELMQDRRGWHLKIPDLTNGPGKLSKALGVTMESYGGLWYEEPLFIAPGPGIGGELKAGPRVGIQNTGEAVHYPWRFYEEGNPFVSKYR
ncbi:MULTISPECIES: DNA-3-methyladenine glycosylase [Bhargavaea]|uniref:Putative 3-methyladenine DNA glycosylase n=1 Tax=Bhargavaea changchunensis TaxID=2134037 RepID=A0ABW2NG63_9BACL|nr:DNA-3-methyladenine glycosylase [Bhargavaea sp. CC-171006]